VPGYAQRWPAGPGGGRIGERIVYLGLVFPDDPCDAAVAELGPVLVEEHRVIVVAGLVQAVFGQVSAAVSVTAGAARVK
jgi:hypothetical protein